MTTETDSILAVYQRQIDATRDISEAFFDGAGRVEAVLLEQTRKIFEEHLKFFQATAAVRDPQGLATLHTAFFSHSPEDLIKAQQQILNATTDTQTRICDALSKHMNALQDHVKPLPALSGANIGSGGAADIMYSAWRKSFENAMELASLGAKTLPLAFPDTSDTPDSKTEEGRAKK